MITESLEEYKEICSRIASTHESVTKYSTTLILVSSAIFVGTLRLGEPVLASGAPIVSIALITIANVTLLIQSTINYKCRSHNRLVAYRNLIAAEAYDIKKDANSLGKEIPQHAVSFDVCMDLLNKIREERRINFEELGIVGDVFAKKGVFANIGEKKSIMNQGSN